MSLKRLRFLLLLLFLCVAQYGHVSLARPAHELDSEMLKRVYLNIGELRATCRFASVGVITTLTSQIIVKNHLEHLRQVRPSIYEPDNMFIPRALLLTDDYIEECARPINDFLKDNPSLIGR